MDNIRKRKLHYIYPAIVFAVVLLARNSAALPEPGSIDPPPRPLPVLAAYGR
jgi:hypothetical protein